MSTKVQTTININTERTNKIKNRGFPIKNKTSAINITITGNNNEILDNK